jgi:Truncated hemoglobins
MSEVFETLFDKYGGVPVVTEIVATFYARIMSRPNLARYFRNTDMDALKMHQVKFIAYVMGKPAQYYQGRDLQIAHTGFSISEKSFNEVASILEWTLEDFQVEDADIQTIMEAVENTRPLIVNH